MKKKTLMVGLVLLALYGSMLAGCSGNSGNDDSKGTAAKAGAPGSSGNGTTD